MEGEGRMIKFFYLGKNLEKPLQTKPVETQISDEKPQDLKLEISCQATLLKRLLNGETDDLFFLLFL
jgi:hypothetical protein